MRRPRIYLRTGQVVFDASGRHNQILEGIVPGAAISKPYGSAPYVKMEELTRHAMSPSFLKEVLMTQYQPTVPL